jgi:hypothetical protein
MLAAAEQRELDQWIKMTYLNLSHVIMTQCDRYPFRCPLSQLLQNDFTYKKIWLLQAQLATS